ncbi:PAS domain-containing sensor histidine kinase [Dyadobacter crusticola]|uniref:PAS domain-containing sensor histidine kinase n=1 Tax=Dyadobacter crusticola TaxID=292407 RepID=UPI0006924B6E|nr:PAS domain-containing sensor histidine kinase [Dyadobacter crusticola]
MADLVIYTGLGTYEGPIKGELGANGDIFLAAYEETGTELARAEVLIIGPAEPQPVRLVQKISSSEPLLSVLLLADPSQFSSVKQSIQFAAQVGVNTTVISYTNSLDLTPVVLNAALRTRQKRSFRKIGLSMQSLVVRQPFAAVKGVHLGSFLDQAPLGVVLINPQSSKIEALNAKARHILRAEEKDLNIMTLPTLFQGFAFDRIQDVLDNPTNEPVELESPSQTIEVTASQTADEGNGKYIMLFISDISSQKDEQRKIRTVLESLPQMALTLDVKGEANFFTQTWYAYTGQSAPASLGSGWLECIHSEDAGRLKVKWRQGYGTGQGFQDTARVRSAAGQYRWHLFRLVAVDKQHGQVQLWTGSLTDIHDQVSLTQALEHKVAQRTQQLLASNIELEQYARVASHDLQEPLRKISIFAKLVRDQSLESLDESALKYLDKVIGTATRMAQILRDLLSFAHLDKTEEFEMVDLKKVVAEVIEDLELVISEKAASIHVSELPVLAAAPSQMRQLFYNLLNNALKFSKADQAAVISIISKPLAAHQIVDYPELDAFKSYAQIEIRDNGIGFEQKYAEQIFSVFQRLHTATSYEGTGIGLAICKKVVSNHGGLISVDSEPGIGSRFTIILPA